MKKLKFKAGDAVWIKLDSERNFIGVIDWIIIYENYDTQYLVRGHIPKISNEELRNEWFTKFNFWSTPKLRLIHTPKIPNEELRYEWYTKSDINYVSTPIKINFVSNPYDCSNIGKYAKDIITGYECKIIGTLFSYDGEILFHMVRGINESDSEAGRILAKNLQIS